jgi:hypothetical protein
MTNGKFCRKVIGKNMGQPVFCGGDLVEKDFEDPENNRSYKFHVCKICGQSPDLHNPELVRKSREITHTH